MRKGLLFGGLAVAAFAADQITKHIVLAKLPLYRSHPVIEGFFHFTHVRNKGAAFGFLSWAGESWRIPFFVIVSIAAVSLIVMFFRSTPAHRRVEIAGLGLLLGGALGNLYDRVMYGHVVDFLDVFITWGGRRLHWPTFNIADAAITVGVALMILYMFFSKDEPEAAAQAEAAAPKEPGGGADGPKREKIEPAAEL